MDQLEELLAQWMPRQRWFADKGEEVPPPRLVGRITVGAEDDHLARIDLVAVGERVYQVPLTCRPEPAPHLAAALIGRLGSGTDRAVECHVYDGAHDPFFLTRWLRLIGTEGRLVGQGLALRDVRFGDQLLRSELGVRVLSGEQSNTSVIVAGPNPVIVKLFRVLADGANPDVVVQSALAAAGCRRVPTPIGAIEGEWTAPDGTACRGHLAYAAEFLDGSEDAWRVAVRACEAGTPFAAEAQALGEATAEVHALMAARLPTRAATSGDTAALADALLARAAWAIGEAPDLAGIQNLQAAAAEAADVVRALPVEGLTLQRIHGDYHLGQVLYASPRTDPGRGWVLLDFEGEPLRPLAERSRPDLALRDVAGMVRSFDYVAGPEPDAAALAWAREARAAFLDGYGTAGVRPELLHALELDKALYEVVYEVRNRPGWAGIPLRAVRRLT